MSKETSWWLNNNTLIGFGKQAWHRNDSLAVQPNHFDGPVPLERVKELLGSVSPVSVTLRADREVVDTVTGEVTVRSTVDNSRQVIIRPDYPIPGRDFVLGTFRDGYKIHDFEEWCINNVETVLDQSVTEIGISTAGLLRDGAQAWVQFVLPEACQHAGVEFRSWITAFTSLNGSLASGYTTGNQLTVCDNTLSANILAATAAGTIVKRRHSKNSLDNLTEIRDELGIVLATVQEDFIATIEGLTNTAVSDAEWSAFLDVHAPLPEETNKRGHTRRQNYRESLTGLYNSSPMVAPWNGTAFGVVQAVNTHLHHNASLWKTTSRGEANMNRVVKEEHTAFDRKTVTELNKVFAAKRRKQLVLA